MSSHHLLAIINDDAREPLMGQILREGGKVTLVLQGVESMSSAVFC